MLILDVATETASESKPAGAPSATALIQVLAETGAVSWTQSSLPEWIWVMEEPLAKLVVSQASGQPS